MKAILARLFSSFEWLVAWRYLRAGPDFQAKWEPVRVKEIRTKKTGGAR